jgi:hypothetical protein
LIVRDGIPGVNVRNLIRYAIVTDGKLNIAQPVIIKRQHP